jgi:hypothetical protein
LPVTSEESHDDGRRLTLRYIDKPVKHAGGTDND